MFKIFCEHLRGFSSAGRAPALQAGGQRFDPANLHQQAFACKFNNSFYRAPDIFCRYDWERSGRPGRGLIAQLVSAHA